MPTIRSTPRPAALRRLLLCSLLTVTSLASTAAPPSGLDNAGMDPAVRAQDDLFRAANGRWLDQTEIAPDKVEAGGWIVLEDRSDERVRAIVESLAVQPQRPGTIEAKIATFFTSYTDTAAIDRAGLKPLQPVLGSIAAIRSRADLARWMGRMQGRVNTPVALWVQGDAQDPGINRALTWQAGLGMPDRDYFLKTDDERLAKVRSAYEAYLTRLATLAGASNPAPEVRKVLALETRIAQAHWESAALRDPVKTYNPMTPAALARLAPGFDWGTFFAAARLDRRHPINVAQPSAMTGIARLLAEVDLPTWRLYLRLRLLDDHTDVLPQAIRDAGFAFKGPVLSGATSERPRWQKGIAEINTALGEAVGQVYVARHFPPEHKARMQALVGHLLVAFGESIDSLDWMTPATKAAARDKLAKYTVKIGYPERWRDYRALQVRRGDAFGNRARAGRHEWQRLAARAGKPVDRAEWGMTPQTVNAYYNPLLNEIVFPASILQPPFFDPLADDAMNYGAIGAIIGHEISHGFDDSGSQYDGDGRLRNWWTDADRQAFQAIGARLVAQFGAYEPLPGKPLNGQLTLGENIADLSGLQIAYKAYLKTLGGKPSAVIDGRSGEQRFFLGWAQAWRSKIRDQRTLQLLSIDNHAPPRFRANGAPLNHDAFHQAFGTRPGDAMFKPAAERIRIW